MSIYGGIISISIFPGLDEYKLPPQYNSKVRNIEVAEDDSKTAMKSYTVAKVDNVDLVDFDMRILDNKGKLANKGRLEIRSQGVWGSICNQGLNLQSANIICKSLNYRGGHWLSPEENGEKFCRTFDNSDYCAATDSHILYSNINCNENDKHLNQCNKNIADLKSCTHDFDAIIECYNEIFDVDTPVPPGVVRLVSLKSSGESFIGRLEMFSQQKFKPICNLAFTEASAKVACKQMGYYSGEEYKGESTEDFRLNVNDSEGFSGNNVQCRGNEATIKDCNIDLTNIDCKHDQDVVLNCVGDKGDSSGKSQYMHKVVNGPPKL
jgi:deleted-in-malignant-brain-tumors protein 1